MHQNEFENKDNLSAARGCITGIKAGLVFWSIVILIFLSCSSCKSFQTIITRQKVKVITVYPNLIDVSYAMVNRANNIYHKPWEKLYKDGNRYPNQKRKLQCGL
jgi:urate oxidase